MTHYEYLQSRLPDKPSVPCTREAMTFGDKCLNCGYNGQEHGPIPCKQPTARAKGDV